KMSAEDEETRGSKSTTSKPRRAPRNERSRRSKPRDSSIQLNDDEKEELLRKYRETDQNLEKFAQAHNMTTLNVKAMLRSVIKDHNTLARVLGTEAPCDVVRITRSKTRSLQHSSIQGVDMTSNVPIKRGHTWVDLPFNEDDDFDDDYRPGEDDSRDGVGSDSDDEESDHPSELEDEEGGENDELNRTLTVDVSNDSKRESGSKSSELSSRPRPDSATSLTLNAIMAEDDEPSNDYTAFLNTLNNDPDDMPYDEQDDPEYMVPVESLFREDQDEDNYDYWSTTIPQKEMEDLIEDIVPSEKLGEWARNLSPPLHQMETVKQETIVGVRPLTPPRVPFMMEAPVGVVEKIFTDQQRKQLRAQMEQHVQLLTQSYVGCYFEPLLQEEKESAREMLESLSEIASYTGHLGKKSAFYIENLPFAIETCTKMRDITREKPVQPLTKENLIIPHRMLSITKEVLTSSRAILYPHLVSQHRLVQSIGRDGWAKNEIILFAMAYNKYADAPAKHRLPRQSKYSIIAENSLPWRHMNELRWMYNGMKRGKERNGITSHNIYFFDVIEGRKRVSFSKPPRAKTGWTMRQWPKKALPPWFSSTMTRKRIGSDGRDNGISEETIRRKERRIEEGDDENEPIVIVDEGEEGEGIEIEMEEENREGGESEEMKEGTKDNVVKFPMEDDECAMDSMGKSRIGRSPEEVEAVRGEENGADGLPIDFSHLMNEMSPRAGPSRLRTPSPRRTRSTSPDEKSFFPPTPGKRVPSPLEESMPWLVDIAAFSSGFTSPPPCASPPGGSRIKTPGGTMDYVDSLMGYFGTPEEEKERTRASSSKRTNLYSNLFGDFDFDESDDDDETANVTLNEDLVERKDESECRPESVTATIEEKPEDSNPIIPEVVPVKQRKKRKTREEKEKMGMAAIKDVSVRRRVMCALARKASDDIRARMTMHSSVFKQIQNILSQKTDRKERDAMLANLEPLLSEHHRDVLYLLSAFASPDSLPRSLVLSQGRQTYVAAINMMCTIYAYMSKMQRRLSYRQLLRMIVDAYSKGGAEKVLETLSGVLVNDPLLLRVLTDYHTPSVPPLKKKVWESIDLRKGEEAFQIFKENARMERVDLCEVLGGVPTKKMLVKAGKPLSTLMVNHDGEPMLRNKDGKYKEIAVMSEKQIEEERKNKVAEREEEKKAKQREKTRERKEAAKKAKMVERREERAREKKKAMERKQEEEERRREEQQAPPSHPFTRDMDKALLMLYNDVQKVTKRAVRKMAADIPYSKNFTLDQLQSRLDFLLELGDS
ncbi:hypothetical protein PMAYCL1PPCAC_17857, partial [Pristionchus mayeri]